MESLDLSPSWLHRSQAIGDGKKNGLKIPELTVQQNPSYLVKLIPKSQTSGGPYIGGGVNNNEQFVIV